MSRMYIMRSSHVLLLAAGVSAALLLLRRRGVWRRPRSSYLSLAAADASKIADRTLMIECFLKDVATSTLMAPPPKPRDASSVRFVTWNVNILCGPDWKTVVQAEEVAAVLRELDADVIVLQEVPIEALDEKWDAVLKQPMARVRALDALLQGMGYTTQLRSSADNPTLLATRLRVLATDSFTLDEDGPTATVNGTEVWTESRGARYASVLAPNGVPIGVFATHLSHKDATLVRPAATAAAAKNPSPSPSANAKLPPMRHLHGEWADATEVSGVRARQMETLLGHWRRRVAATSSTTSTATATSRPTTTIILADYNQPVKEHYDAEEWRVIAAGLTSPYVNQPLKDGVQPLLHSHGFRCAFAEAAADNFHGRPAPAFTHWTGTTVDFAYVHGESAVVRGAYVRPSPLSDHLPVVIDLVP